MFGESEKVMKKKVEYWRERERDTHTPTNTYIHTEKESIYLCVHVCDTALDQRLGTRTEDMPRITISIQKDSHNSRKN